MTILSDTLDSSMIDSIEYDTESNVLLVRFNNGSLYAYDDVDEDVYHEIVDAPSAGTYFAYNVRWDYDYMRLEGKKMSKMSLQKTFAPLINEQAYASDSYSDNSVLSRDAEEALKITELYKEIKNLVHRYSRYFSQAELDEEFSEYSIYYDRIADGLLALERNLEALEVTVGDIEFRAESLIYRVMNR